MKKLWEDFAWDIYVELPTTDRAYLKKLNRIIKDVERNGYANAEPLRNNLSGYYSRAEVLEIYSVKGHYSDK